MAVSPGTTEESVRKPDRVAGALAAGFVVLLLATELVLTLPDETDSAASVARFYVAHRGFIIVLQVLGIVAAALLGGYAWRLRSVDRVVAAAGIIMAACGWSALIGDRVRILTNILGGFLLAVNGIALYWLITYLNPLYGPK